jgi:predicted amidohydrolase
LDAVVTVACIQAEPVVLDREQTIDKLERLTAEAAAAGAQLAVFPEAFVPAYPSSTWARAFAGWGEPGAKEAFALLARESVAVPGPAAERIAAAAREHGMHLVTGVTELDPERPSTLYNTLLYHGPDGTLLSKHRKLVPTNHERLVWGQGDGGGLRAIPTDLGRLGGLICWENYMPLARFALYESGVEIYVASMTVTRGRRRSSTSRASRARSWSPPPTSSASRPTPPSSRCARSSTASGRSAAAARRSSAPRAPTSPARSTTKKGSCTPTSIRRGSGRNASASTPPGTTTARTSCG